MVACAVFSCKNYSAKKGHKYIKYFSFPRDKSLSDEWIKACGRGKVFNIKFARICSTHFTEKDWQPLDIMLNLPMKQRRLREGAMPTLKLRFNYDGDESSKEEVLDSTLEDAADIKLCDNDEFESVKEEVLEYTADTSTWTVVSIHEPTLNIGAQTTCVINVSREVQTEVDINCSWELENIQLKRELKESKKETKKYKTKWEESQCFNSSIANIFTQGQIKRLQNPNKALNWSNEDISFAVSLHSAGPRAYKLLRERNFPLPEESTLRRWAAKLKLQTGISSTSVNEQISIKSEPLNTAKNNENASGEVV